MIRYSAFALLALSLPALADPARIVDAQFRQTGDSWSVSVTLSHPESGWDDYADGWRVETADGTILGTRVLAHPHENEQPFTRSLGGVEIPEGVAQVMIRSRTTATGWDDEARAFPLP